MIGPLSLRRKTLVVVVASVLTLVALTGLAAYRFLLRGIEGLEAHHAGEAAEMGAALLEGEASRLADTVEDWGAWDDIYAFAGGDNPEWPRRNLSGKSFATLKIDVLAAVDVRGALLVQAAFDPRSRLPVRFPDGLRGRMAPGSALLSRPTGRSGLLGLPEGILLLAVRPILRADRTGPPRGALLMGRFLGPREVARLAALAHADLALEALPAGAAPRGEAVTARPTDRASAVAVVSVPDIYGRPVIRLRSRVPRTLSAHGRAGTRHLLLVLLGAGVCFGAATLCLIDRLLLARLGLLIGSIRRIGGSRDLAARVALEGGDELGTLAGAVNGMLEEIERGHRDLSQSRALLASVLDNTDNAILALDAGGRVVFFNRRYLELWHDDPAYLATGPTVYDLIRRACREGVYAGADVEALVAARRADLARCGQSRVPLETPRQDGVLIEAYAVALPGGGHLLSYRDVTDRKRAEEELRASEGRYRTLVEASPDAVLVHLADRILLANPAARALFGARRGEELFGRSYLEFVAPADREAVAHRRRALLEEGRSLPPSEQRIVRLDQRTVDVEAASVPFAYQGQPAALTILRDITERKKAQQELARLAAAVEQATEVIVVTDAQGVIEYLNPAFERQSGWKRADFVGRPAADLATTFGAHAAEAVRRAMSRPEPWVGRLRGRTRSGAECELEAAISPVFDAKGALINFVGVHHDVTRQVRLEAQMRQAQKLEAIGTLAGGIAHDFNNILAAILGYAELAWETIPADHRAREDLGHVIHAAERARDLVRQILSFSQQQEQERAAVDLASLVEEALPLLRASLPSSVAIEVAPGSARPVVLADPVQLHQVLLNLGTNAGHAMRERGGTLRVALEEVDVASNREESAAGLPAGPHARLSVSDTGCGIPEELLGRIFEPFFTTKDVGEGTGLGLAVVHGVVQAHGGRVTVESSPGRGATFHVHLPAVQEPPRQEEFEAAALARGTERVLLGPPPSAFAV